MTTKDIFAGIKIRPYDQVKLRDVNWYAIKPIAIPFNELWLTQHHLNIEGILGKRFSLDPLPRVVRFAKEFYLEDGHHRVVLSALSGIVACAARVYKLESG